MKTNFSRIASVVMISAFTGQMVSPQPAEAASNHAHHTNSNASEEKFDMTDGLVKKLDKQKGNVVITHGPLPNGMPAMTMSFRAKDPKWIDQLKEEQKIRFVTEEVNGVMILQRYEAVK